MDIWVYNPPFHDRFSRAQRSPAVTKSGTVYYPIWLAYVVGVLEDAGHNVLFTDAPVSRLRPDQHLAEAVSRDVRMVVVDMSTASVENDISVCRAIRNALPGAFLVAVGPHVSALPEETMKAGEVLDAVVRQEADYTVRDLAAVIGRCRTARPSDQALAAVEGLTFRDSNGNIVENLPRPLIEDLDKLPWVSKVYKKHLKIRDYFNPNAPPPMITLISSRGCPFKCNFCLYPQTLTGNSYRFRSIDDIVSEMEFVTKEFPEARSVFFEDDTLTSHKKRCRDLAQAILDRGIHLQWVANSRVEVDLETLKLLKKSGCRHLCVGFESGDPESLKYMGKGTTPERMLQFMDDARKADIDIHGCFMVGFPGEDRAALKRTMDLALQLNPSTAQFYPIMVYPGTKAYDDYRSRQWLTARSYRDWLTPEGLHNCVIHNEHFSARELVQWCDAARRRFYLRPGYLLRKAHMALIDPYERARTFRGAKVFFKHLVLGSRV